jgi:Arc/MetJ-type ribon-helix-helix transcriptional regulator
MENKKEPEEMKGGQQQKKSHKTLDELGAQVEKFAVKTAESIRKAIDRALESRNTVLTIRINDESNKKLSMLVDAGLFKSRSESAAFFIEEGIKTQAALFTKISNKLEEINKIKEELKNIVSEEIIDRSSKG